MVIKKRGVSSLSVLFSEALSHNERCDWSDFIDWLPCILSFLNALAWVIDRLKSVGENVDNVNRKHGMTRVAWRDVLEMCIFVSVSLVIIVESEIKSARQCRIGPILFVTITFILDDIHRIHCLSGFAAWNWDYKADHYCGGHAKRVLESILIRLWGLRNPFCSPRRIVH